ATALRDADRASLRRRRGGGDHGGVAPHHVAEGAREQPRGGGARGGRAGGRSRRGRRVRGRLLRGARGGRRARLGRGLRDSRRGGADAERRRRRGRPDGRDRGAPAQRRRGRRPQGAADPSRALSIRGVSSCAESLRPAPPASAASSGLPPTGAISTLATRAAGATSWMALVSGSTNIGPALKALPIRPTGNSSSWLLAPSRAQRRMTAAICAPSSRAPRSNSSRATASPLSASLAVSVAKAAISPFVSGLA